MRAAISASRPLPPRSCSLKVKPLDVPSSGIDGGLSEKTNASLMPMKVPIALPAIASALFSFPGRSSQGFSGVNMIAFA